MTEKEIREKLASYHIETKMFIGGEYISHPSSGTYNIYDPGNANIHVATITLGNASDMAYAVHVAHETFLSGVWSGMSAEKRADILFRFAEGIKKNAEFLATIETLSIGKLYEECLMHEADRAANNIAHAACAIRTQTLRYFEDTKKFIGNPVATKSMVRREPFGVGGIIIPWNGPLLHSTWKFADCIAAGNTCVIKPPAWGALSVIQLGRIAKEAGLPDGVLNIVPGEREVGRALVENPDVARISFTGSHLGGLAVLKSNAEVGRFLSPSFELGGKNPNIVFADADLKYTTEGVARSCFRSQGQSCVAGSRVLVEKSIYEEFGSMLVRRIKGMKIGHQTDPKVEIGPIITKEHLAHIKRLNEIAIQEGGTLLTGGEEADCYRCGHPKGNYFEPTLFAGVTPTMTIWKEEVFGPIIVIVPFSDEKEAITLANDTLNGLSANIWIKDIEKAYRVSDKLDTGMVWINGHFLRDLRAPFGGRKNSGSSSEGGEYSMDLWTEPKMVCTTIRM